MSDAGLVSTLRLQLTPEFGFDSARHILPYVQQLGITALYLSPIFESTPGSKHGYDVTDPRSIRDELGGESQFDRLAAEASHLDIAILLDIVPNHMAAHALNPWWWDVLKRGRASRVAHYFDIRWEEADGRLVLPVLGTSLEQALAEDDLQVSIGSPHDPQEYVLQYHDQSFPLSPDTEVDTPLSAIVAQQHYRLMYWRHGLQQLNYRRFFDISDLVCMRIEDDSVFQATHALISRLLTKECIAGVRVDHIDGLMKPAQYLTRLREDVRDNSISNRTHPPLLLVEKILCGDETLPDTWPVDGTTGYEFLARLNPLFVDVTGYDHLADLFSQSTHTSSNFREIAVASKRQILTELFPAELRRLTALLGSLSASAADGSDSADSVDGAVLMNVIVEFTAQLEVYRTYYADGRFSHSDERRIRDALRRAEAGLAPATTQHRTALVLLELVFFPADSSVPTNAISDTAFQSRRDEFILLWQQLSGPAMAKGVEDTALYRHIVLTSMNEVGAEPQRPHNALDAFHRFNIHIQHNWPRQLTTTSTHDTKRGEDTRARIHVLSECSEDWCTACRMWQQRHAPLRSVIADSHSPSPADELLIYQTVFGSWPLKPLDGRHCANRTLSEHYCQRICDYVVKAAREAKQHSHWYEPDTRYEQGLQQFLQKLLLQQDGDRFRNEMAELVDQLALPGIINSLSQLLLKAMSPGIADFYQGTELWSYTLVDPDNRQSIDFYAREQALQQIAADAQRDLPGTIDRLRDDWCSGWLKLFLTHLVLTFRSDHPALCLEGSYHPAEVTGPHSRHIIAFAREHEDDIALVIAPRLVAGLTESGRWPLGSTWQNTRVVLPPSIEPVPHLLTDVVTGRKIYTENHRIALADAMTHLPLALLTTGTSPRYS